MVDAIRRCRSVGATVWIHELVVEPPDIGIDCRCRPARVVVVTDRKNIIWRPTLYEGRNIGFRLRPVVDRVVPDYSEFQIARRKESP